MEEIWAGLIIHFIEQVSRTLSDTSCPTDSEFWGSIWDLISNLLTEVSYQDDLKYFIILYYFEIISQDFVARFHSRAVLCKNEEGGANALAAATRPWADFWFFVCRCLSKNDRTSHISVAPGEVLEICQEAGEKHIFKAFFGQIFLCSCLSSPLLSGVNVYFCFMLFWSDLSL